jgi:hypothetical protein
MLFLSILKGNRDVSAGVFVMLIEMSPKISPKNSDEYAKLSKTT